MIRTVLGKMSISLTFVTSVSVVRCVALALASIIIPTLPGDVAHPFTDKTLFIALIPRQTQIIILFSF